MDIEIELMEGATPPIYATQGAAGFDFYAKEDITIDKYDTKLIGTGIKALIPEGFKFDICSRSGLALKKHVFVLNSPGIIDSDYRGEIGIILTNAGHEPFEIKKGDRIAQGILTEVLKANFTVVESISEHVTERASGGFGHTGV